VGIGILVNSVTGIVDAFNGKELEAPGMLALVAAAVSIIFKEVLYQYTVFKGKELGSKVVVANAWHHRSDAFSSIGTLIGIAGAIFLGEKWRVLDPIAAFIVSVFIIKVAVDLIKPCIDELLEKSLSKEVEERILTIITAFPEIDSPHHLRTRRIGNNIAIEIHIRMDGTMSLTDAHDITKKIEAAIKNEFGAATHIGIHMEPKKGESCE
jgi:cation diffusion facilitator family transporter